jgi:arylsulfatase A-like enzyme
MHGDEVTIAEKLQEAGYETGIFGKWHLGDNYPMRPQDQGFTRSLIHRSWGISAAPDDWNSYFDPTLWDDGEQIETKGYCTDLFTDALVEFVEANRDRPFFAYLSTNTPHTPLQIALSYSQPYLDMGLDEQTAKIYGMISNIDENVGRVIAKLDELGLRENTIVIFLTDNGPQQDRYNAGLRDRKTSTYEGGIRVPFFIRWPAGITKKGGVDRIAAHIDIFPTLLEACGVEIPDQPKLDGKSLLPLMVESESAWKNRELIFQCHRGLEPKRYQNCAVVTQEFKLIGFPGTFSEENLDTSSDPVFELYDIANDPGEKQDLSAQHPETVEALKASYDRWYENVRASRQFTPQRIHLGSTFENPVLLCRYQDGTYKDGRSLGWDVLIETAGVYEVTISQQPFSGPGKVYLDLNGVVESRELKIGGNQARFNLPEGEARIDIWMQEDGKPRIIFTENDSAGDVEVELIGRK